MGEDDVTYKPQCGVWGVLMHNSGPTEVSRLPSRILDWLGWKSNIQFPL